ncbi:cytochrome c biogenesis protein CcsA [bacterium]|nr:cytochrome c biogenesis protein CcsA [bacterium]
MKRYITKQNILKGSFFLGVILWSMQGLFGAGVPETARIFGQLPIQANGRIKPVDSLARETLLYFSHKQSTLVNGKKMSASEWLLDVVSNPDIADSYSVFKIQDGTVKDAFHLDEKERYFSFNELKPHYTVLEKHSISIEKLDKSQQSLFQQHILTLYDQLNLYMRLQSSLYPSNVVEKGVYLDELGQIFVEYAYLLTGKHGVPPQSEIIGDAVDHSGHNHGPSSEHDHGNNHDNHDGSGIDRENMGWKKLSFVVNSSRYYEQMAVFKVFPPEQEESVSVKEKESNQLTDNWAPLATLVTRSVFTGKENPVVRLYASFLDAVYKKNNSKAIESGQDLLRYYDKQVPRAFSKAKNEALFNRLQIFYRSMVLFLLAAVCIGASWLIKNRAVFWIGRQFVFVAFGLQVIGQVFRMVIQGRPPVTNLYSSAVFVGLMAVLLGMIVERFFKNKLGLFVSAVIGFITLIVAHNLSIQGDTLEMMQAVLDSNFWLSTHVVSIVIGYSGMFLSGFLGIVFICRYFFGRSFSDEDQRELYKMVYGIVCFNLAMNFVGTVLGGIWADQSWGRFWGWDPKENGALLIVIWSALMLHARMAGIFRVRGFMVAAVFGNIVTAMSWFGVNMLGIGLHSYGFMDSAFVWLLLFCMVQVFFIILGLLPPKWVTPKIR